MADGDDQRGRRARPRTEPARAPELDVRDRRRAIQRAIRDRQDPPAGLEEVAMQVALRQSGLRWFVVLYAFGFLVEVLGFVVADSAAARARDALLALLFLGLGYVQWRIGQRARQAVDRWSETYPDEPSAQPVRRRRPGPGPNPPDPDRPDPARPDPDRPDPDRPEPETGA